MMQPKNTCALRGAQWRFMMGETTAGWSTQLHSDWSVAEGRLTEVEFLNLPLRLQG